MTENPKSEGFQKAIGAWADIAKTNAEIDISKAAFTAILEAAPEIEKFVDWVVAIIGAAVVLLLSNLGSLKTSVYPCNLKTGLGLLLVAGVVGARAKTFGLYVEILRRVNHETTKLILPLLTEYEQKELEIESVAKKGQLQHARAGIDFERVLADLMSPYPCYARPQIKRAFEEGKKDQLWTFKRAAKLQVKQGHRLVLAIVLSVAGAVVIAVGLH